MSSNLLGQRREVVLPHEVESELRQMWREASTYEPSSEGLSLPRVRSTLSNFIIICSAELEDAVGAYLLTELSILHPSRFFVVSPDSSGVAKDGDNKLIETAVSSRCVRAQSGAHVCSEEIYLSYVLGEEKAVSSFLMSSFVSDVPTIMLVLGDVSEGSSADLQSSLATLVREVRVLANSVIYDSLYFRSYLEGVQVFDCPEDSKAEKELCLAPLIVSDLSWIALSRWREVVAGEFDAASLMTKVSDIKNIQLEYRSSLHVGTGCPSEVFLFVAWIAFSLELRLDGAERKNGQYRFSFVSVKGHPVVFILNPSLDTQSSMDVSGADTSRLFEVSPDRPSGICGVRISFSRSSEELVFFRHGTDMLSVSVNESGRVKASRSVRFVEPKFHQLVVQDCAIDHTDSSFRKIDSLSRELSSRLVGSDSIGCF